MGHHRRRAQRISPGRTEQTKQVIPRELALTRAKAIPLQAGATLCPSLMELKNDETVNYSFDQLRRIELSSKLQKYDLNFRLKRNKL